jgi:hypothetical protein
MRLAAEGKLLCNSLFRVRRRVSGPPAVVVADADPTPYAGGVVMHLRVCRRPYPPRVSTRGGARPGCLDHSQNRI